MRDHVSCRGCGAAIHKLVAETSRDAIELLKKREHARPIDVPKSWRDGPLCYKCQAQWSALIG